jgi:hypothetical protein
MSRPVPVLRPKPVPPLPPAPSRLPGLACALAALLVAAGAGCDGDDGTGGGGGAGGGGGSGAATASTTCQDIPQPTFLLRVIEQAGGPLPPDTKIEVMWSAAKEEPFLLDDPSTWGTLETSNIACDVDPSAPPTDLTELTCELWTASPTQVRVSAKGYVTEEDTFVAEPGECAEPTPIEIELAPEHQ